jgi:hypothetical protein
VHDQAVRWLVSGFSLACWSVYFFFAGRRRDAAARDFS